MAAVFRERAPMLDAGLAQTRGRLSRNLPVRSELISVVKFNKHQLEQPFFFFFYLILPITHFRIRGHSL